MIEKIAYRLGYTIGSTTVTDFIIAAVLVATLLTMIGN